jgi:hypothetical protein
LGFSVNLQFILIFLKKKLMEGSCDTTDLLISRDSYLTEKYQFIAKIGEGCFGKIFKVKNRGRSEISVLKV